MKPLTAEWVTKAEGDFATAQRELRVRRSPNYDAACFHAQQCAEKYLKARLQEANIPFGRTHHLEPLLQALLAVEPDWVDLRPVCRGLSSYAVELRYPGESADKAAAKEAVAFCRNIRRRVRRSLKLRS